MNSFLLVFFLTSIATIIRTGAWCTFNPGGSLSFLINKVFPLMYHYGDCYQDIPIYEQVKYNW